MGLPQVSSTDGAGEAAAASLGSFLQCPPRFGGMATCDLDGLHGGSVSQTVGNALSSSLGDFQRKTSLELSKYSGNSFGFEGPVDVTSNVHGLKTGSVDKIGQFTPKSGRNIPNPASRIVGFESHGTSCLNIGSEGVSADLVCPSSVAGVTINEAESSGSLVRKRLLSPLNSMLSTEQFNGDSLDIGCHASQTGPSALTDNFNVAVAHDYKKANVGSKINFSLPSWSFSSCLERRNVLYDNTIRASVFFTDGPLLENKDPHAHNNCLHSPGLHHFQESTEVRSRSRAISLSPRKAISPSLSLSPLGPKFSERTKTARGCRDVKSNLEDCHLDLENVERSFERHDLGIVFTSEEAEFRITSRSFEDIDLFRKDFRPSSLEVTGDLGWSLFRESVPSQCMRYTRSLSGFPVRRSLVGSFEESLLSGRFFSGKFAQVSINVMQNG